MAYNNPSIADFQGYFLRDFPYTSDITTGVTSQDIANAYGLVNININQGLFGSQENYTIGYFYLAAHYLVLNVRAGSQGINGQATWIQQSKAVQGVTETFSIPQRILDNPLFAQLVKTNYGYQFLQIVLPQLSGQVISVQGGIGSDGSPCGAAGNWWTGPF